MQVFKKFILPALALVLMLPIAILYIRSATPAVEIDPGTVAVGTATPVRLKVVNPHGIRQLTATLEQGGQRYIVHDQRYPSHRILFANNEPARDYQFVTGLKTTPALKEGKAVLVVEAVSNDFGGSVGRATRDLVIVTKPPRVIPEDELHYINQGGSELVTYTVGGYATGSGVKVGDLRFRGFPVAGTERGMALFAYPWNAPLAMRNAPLAMNLVVFATSAAAANGEEITAPIRYKLFPKKFRKRDIKIEDPFLEKVAADIDPGGQGDLLARFLKINGQVRRQNNQTLADLKLRTADHFLWSGPFLQLSKSQVEAQFADVRSYIYQGKKVDEQVHLGFDLAKVKNTPIGAANDGKVLLAEKLGIYGNCVVVDHGLSLQSIYGHLSEFKVKAGDDVKKGQMVGLSGATGLAGGDHLHFSMQIEGVQVNPVEWWDEHWIRDHVLRTSKPAALKSSDENSAPARAGGRRRGRAKNRN